MNAGAAVWIANALFLGIRHGVDWDHLAAISDIVSNAASGNRQKADWRHEALSLSLTYAVGHAVVVALLGFAALSCCLVLPHWVDPLMERLVGVTLLALSGWVFYSIMERNQMGKSFPLRSRWMLLWDLARIVKGRMRLRAAGGAGGAVDSASVQRQYGHGTACGIGAIHGIGAETGTQVLVLSAIGGAAANGLGTAMLIAFIAGLLLSNFVTAALIIRGFRSLTQLSGAYLAFGVCTATFGLIIGTAFACGKADAFFTW